MADLNLDKCFTVSLRVPYSEELTISSSDMSTWSVASVGREFPPTRDENGHKLLILTFNPGEQGVLVGKQAKGILKIFEIFGLKCVPRPALTLPAVLTLRDAQ